MKKILLITLIAMMLFSMVAFTGCKPKVQEEAVEEVAPVEEPAPVEEAPAEEVPAAEVTK
ncbi:MAG: hypothetical protein U1C33_07380 [Candidatus Cloacimonadaceae bacterium]|nr:hypothetical protein [Candidatus Cloacimonadaceae bacterium]